MYILADSTSIDFNKSEDIEVQSSTNGSVFTFELSGHRPGYQGLDGNHRIFNFDNEAVLEFSKVFGSTVMDLDTNLESVVDTGDSLIFQFIGGGSITLDGISGYDDFTSFSMDYLVLINH